MRAEAEWQRRADTLLISQCLVLAHLMAGAEPGYQSVIHTASQHTHTHTHTRVSAMLTEAWLILSHQTTPTELRFLAEQPPTDT